MLFIGAIQISPGPSASHEKIVRALINTKIGIKMIRILIDEGSQVSFISSQLAHHLITDINYCDAIEYRSFNGATSECNSYALVKLQSVDGSQIQLVNCYITDVLPNYHLPIAKCWIEKAKELSIVLSDYQAECNPWDPLDMVIGGNYAYKIITGRQWITDTLISINTKFGWALTGLDPLINSHTANTNSAFTTTEKSDSDLIWEIEGSSFLTDQQGQSFCQQFMNQLNLQNGRYFTALPWTKEKPELVSNFNVALKRLLSLKASLIKNQLYNEYDNLMQEQVKNGFAERIPINSQFGYFLPHRAVYTPQKDTTKIRIVYDGGSHAKQELALNHCLHTGTPLNANLMELLIYFRIHKIAFIADIEKAYPQIKMNIDERPFLKFLWMEDQHVIAYQMQSVVFGANCSPFILACVIRKHLTDHQKDFPKAHSFIHKFYVDDLVSSVQNVSIAQESHKQLTQVFRLCSMNLRKWRCSHPDLDKEWRSDSATDETTVLGFKWNVKTDQLRIKPVNLTPKDNWTKRTLLKTIASIFDPLGSISPAILKARCELQKLFHESKSWDDNVGHEQQSRITEALNHLFNFHLITIPRWIQVEQLKEIAVFCDASKAAYGAVIYAINRQTKNTTMICSKTRLCPRRSLTIPALELAAAALAIDLTAKIKNQINKLIINYYSDSKITLDRVQNKSRNNRDVFVRNRIRKILTDSTTLQWHYVNTNENPADILTRGCSAESLPSNRTWNHGPPWLASTFPKIDETTSTAIHSLSALLHTPLVSSIFNPSKAEMKFGTYSVHLLIMKWLARLRCKQQNQREEEQLKRQTTICSIRMQQREMFGNQIRALSKNRDNKYVQVEQYYVYLDKNNILRIKTRFQTGEISIDSPIVLTSKSELTRSMILYWHWKLKHPSKATFTSILREQYVIIGLRDSISEIHRSCVRCKFIESRPIKASFGLVPKFRTEMRFFQSIGVDHFGPIFVKDYEHSKVTRKVYVLIGTCASTRLIHLEMCNSLDALDTYCALIRMFTIRGTPRLIYSDNGTAFVHLHKKYKELHKQHPNLTETAALIPTWKFSSPGAPWQGGFFERLIQNVKRGLKIVQGSEIISKELFRTLLSQIESLINSRPLCATAENSFLTPSHFLHDKPLTSVDSAEEIPDLEISPLLKNFEQVERIRDKFWKRWKNDYILTIRNRFWNRSDSKVNIGDLVLVINEQSSRLHWPIGRIVEMLPGQDGIVRNVIVSLKGQRLRRPIQKLVKLCETVTF